MLDIRVNGESLDLPEDIAIPYEQNSPLFRDPLNIGSFSYPGYIDATPKNKRIAKWISIIESTTTTTSDVCDIYWGSDLYKSGAIRFKEAGKRIAFEIYMDDSVLVKSLQTTNINTLLTDQIDLLSNYPTSQYGGDEAILRTVTRYPDYTHNFPSIKNPTFYNNKTADNSNPAFLWQGFINSYDPNPIDKFNYIGPRGADDGESWQYNLCPQIYFVHAIKAALASLGYNLAGTLFNDEELLTLLIYGNMATDYLAPPTNAYNINLYGVPVTEGQCLPQLTAADLLKTLETLFCAAAIIDSTTKKVNITPFNHILNSTDFLDITKYVDVNKTTTPNYQLYKGITFKFTQDTDDAAAHNGTISLDGLIRDANVADYADLLSIVPTQPGIIRLVLNQNQFYISYNTGAGYYWQFHSDNYYDYIDGEGGETIQCPMQPIGMDYHTTMPSTDIAAVPIIQEYGSSTMYDGTEVYGMHKNNPRIMFYRGMQNGFANNYPMASTGVYDYSGTKIANYSLAWDGEFGCVNVWHKGKINLLKNSKLIKARAYLPYTFFKQLDWTKKVRVNTTNYLLKSIKSTLYLNHISASEIEKYKV